MDASVPASSDTETVARAYFAAVAARDVEAMAACWEPGAPDVIHGVVEMIVPDDLRAWFGGLFAAFPDFSFAILDVMTTGEKAAVRYRASGTFDGPASARFEGLIPNGGRVDIEGCDVLTVRDGLIRRNDAYLNGAEMARQLGALPPAGSAPERAMTGALNLKTRLATLIRKRRS
jgi:predicted ester cyclase